MTAVYTIRRMRVLGLETFRIYRDGKYIGREAPSRGGAWTILRNMGVDAETAHQTAKG